MTIEQPKEEKEKKPAEDIALNNCKHKGVKRLGESCMRNNKCEYPDCLEKPVDETEHLLSTEANRGRVEESIKQLEEKEERTFTEKDMIGFAEWIQKEFYISTTLAHESPQQWKPVHYKDGEYSEGEEVTTTELLTKYLKQ